MRLYTINKDYINYLKEFDEKVANVDYKDKFKLFVGKVKLQNNNENVKYYIPLTSYKEKFETPESDKIDIFKVKDKHGEKFTSVLNINNMIPAPDIAVTEFGYDQLRNNNGFRTYADKDRYYHLTIDELNYINENKDTIEYKARTIFSMTKDNNAKYKNLADRCCNFVDLYTHAIEYNDILTSEVEDLMSQITKEFKELGVGDNKQSNTYKNNDFNKEK